VPDRIDLIGDGPEPLYFIDREFTPNARRRRLLEVARLRLPV
jgi:hypothetical protein